MANGAPTDERRDTRTKTLLWAALGAVATGVASRVVAWVVPEDRPRAVEVATDWATGVPAYLWVPAGVLVAVSGALFWKRPRTASRLAPLLILALVALLVGSIFVGGRAEARTALFVEVGIRRAAGPLGAQADFSGTVSARPGDRLEVQVRITPYEKPPRSVVLIVAKNLLPGSEPQEEPLEPRIPPGVRVIVLHAPGPISGGETADVVIHPAAGPVRLFAPQRLRAFLDGHPPQRRAVYYEWTGEGTDTYIGIVWSEWIRNAASLSNVLLRFDLRVGAG